MIMIFALAFFGFGAKMHTMQEVNARCKASTEASAMCVEVAKSPYIVAGTNKTPLGIDE